MENETLEQLQTEHQKHLITMQTLDQEIKKLRSLKKNEVILTILCKDRILDLIYKKRKLENLGSK